MTRRQKRLQAEYARAEARVGAAQDRAMQLQDEVTELRDQARKREDTLKQTVALAVARASNFAKKKERLETAYIEEARRAATAQ